MSEKRFRVNYDVSIYDSETEEYISTKNGLEKIAKRMNELNDENEQLRFQLEECSNNKLFSRRELERENEQLRQVNNDFEKLFSETISIADTSQLLENGNYDIKRMFVKELVDSLMSENEQLRQSIEHMISKATEISNRNILLHEEIGKLNRANKELQDKMDWLCEQTGYDGAKFRHIEELKEKLREKEEDEQLYANEILELREANKEFIQFKELGGNY